MKISSSIIPLLLVFLGFLIYSNVLHGPFILDDELFILTNYQIRDISNFLKDFSGTRYIGFLSFAVNYYFGGLNTFGYHVVNIVIHILNAILVYILIQLTIGVKGSRVQESFSIPMESLNPRILPFAVSLIFLVHPIQTQAVSYITQRFTSLATLFYLLALVLYVKYRLWAIGNGQCKKPITYRLSPIAYCLSIIFAILAMKTKESSFTLPFIIILYEWTFFDSRGQQIRTRLLYLIPFLLTLVIIPLDLFSVHKNPIEQGLQDILQKEITNDQSIYDSILTQFNVMVTYIRLLFIPVHQNLWYDYPISRSIFEAQTFLSFILIIFMLCAAIYLYWKSRRTDNVYGVLISFGIFWFFITLSVVSVMPLSGVIFEHWLYLPSIGFILSITATVVYIFNYLEKKTKKSLIYYLASVILIITVSFSFSTYQRNILWADNYEMWLDVVKKSPNNAMAHNNLGLIYASQGRFDEAIKEYLTALKINPDSAKAHNNLGDVYYHQGKLDDTMMEYLTALNINPDDAGIHSNLGLVYAGKGMLDKAIKEYVIAINIKPELPLAHNNLGNAYFGKEKFDEAIKEYLAALRFDPNNPEIHYNLGLAYKKGGLKDEAKKEFEITLKLKPDFTKVQKIIESLE